VDPVTGSNALLLHEEGTAGHGGTRGTVRHGGTARRYSPECYPVVLLMLTIRPRYCTRR